MPLKEALAGWHSNPRMPAAMLRYTPLHRACSYHAADALLPCFKLPTPWPLTSTLPGDKRGGAVRVLYDTTTSERGALLAVGRAPRAASAFDSGLPLVIKTPHALPMYREDTGRKRSRLKERQVRGEKQAPAAQLRIARVQSDVDGAVREL